VHRNADPPQQDSEGEMITIKKYSNRRLYDSEESRYITLEELAARIRQGDEVRVVDAASGRDLTQVTLAQIVLESRGAGRLLPVPLLVQMIRMGDDLLADFLGRYLAWALGVYLQARQMAAQPFSGLDPGAALRHAAQSLRQGASPAWSQPWPSPWMPGPWAGLWGSGEPAPPWPGPAEPPPAEPVVGEPAPPPAAAAGAKAETGPAEDELAALRRELAEIRAALGSRKGHRDE
jgi:polyhydroxyalkanoate synthesis repressor PhaR